MIRVWQSDGCNNSARFVDASTARSVASELEDFEALAKAHSHACGGTLEYQHPGMHDLETPQLLCRPCGGFYEVAALL